MIKIENAPPPYSKKVITLKPAGRPRKYEMIPFSKMKPLQSFFYKRPQDIPIQKVSRIIHTELINQKKTGLIHSSYMIICRMVVEHKKKGVRCWRIV